MVRLDPARLLGEIQSAERVVGFDGRQRSDYLRQLTTSRQMLIMSYKLHVRFSFHPRKISVRFVVRVTSGPVLWVTG